MAIGSGKTSVSSKLSPITDGIILSPEMTGDFQNHYVSITFYDDETGRNIVPKSLMAGSVMLSATKNGVEWGSMWVDEDKTGQLLLGDAGDLSGELSGTYLKVRASLGITAEAGATHCRLTVDSYRV